MINSIDKGKLDKILFWEKKSVWTFFNHMLKKLDEHISKWWRCLIITTTKKSAEEISNLLLEKWYKAYFLHSEIDTLERFEIIKKLRSGKIDVLVGVNLLREWIDIPEVTFIAILDADQEWFLRSTTALIQIIWRAARNPNSEVVLYADKVTNAMKEAVLETHRRRSIQEEFNKKHWITPKMAISNIKNLEAAKDDDIDIFAKKEKNKKKLKRMTKKEKEIILKTLEEQLKIAIDNWEFEKAAEIRDQIKELANG